MITIRRTYCPPVLVHVVSLICRDNDSATADEILEVANRTLHHSGYLLVSGKIISGREEAASGWATANYALQNFSPLTVSLAQDLRLQS